MEVRTKPAMCKGKLRSVLVGTFSVGLAISAFSGLGLGSGTENADAAAPEPGAVTQDIVWSSPKNGDIVWTSESKAVSKDDIVWGAKSAESSAAPSVAEGVLAA
ncbi:hypothetical protein [Streptomyces sp. KL118A]|uniref:hypothetical protein n=1 Tax=Streptomyces sp. KL118A TaxID=3045153 RepID=UPI00278BE793|nr:hypothetical protein [Streptomyces sp. KL118A]